MLPQSAFQIRRAVAADIDAVLREAVTELHEPLRHMAQYHFGWVDSDGAPTDPHERVARRRAATFTLLAAGSDGSCRLRARNVAVANTLMFAGMFIHDDLVDGDRVRYGIPTIWASFGKPAAVHLGTALVALAFDRLGGEAADNGGWLRHQMASCVSTIGQGQTAEAVLKRKRSVGLTEVMRVYAAKAAVPASYFFSSGAASVNAPADRVAAATRLGRAFGLAYQLRNDYASLWEDPYSQLEDPLSDLRQRKPTIIAVYALQHAPSTSAELADFYSQPATSATTLAELVHIRSLLEQCGAKTWLENQVRRRTDSMLQWIPRAAPDLTSEAELTIVLSDLCRLSEP
ncbi:polyprenyl synthetase family protein [Nocardia thraciensis]